MPKKIVAYRRSHAVDAALDRVEASSDSAPAAEAVAAWTAFFDAIGPPVVGPGQPMFRRTNVGEVGASTVLGGDSIIEADDLDGAPALAGRSDGRAVRKEEHDGDPLATGNRAHGPRNHISSDGTRECGRSR